jgi:lipopolysaccharide export system protein LptA
MKKVVIVLLLILALKAEQIKIDAKEIHVNEQKQFTEFIGNATVTKGEDKLSADRIVSYFDKKGKFLKYVALGNVNVRVFLNEKHYSASGDALTYDVQNQIYILEGNAFLAETDTDKKLYGEIIEANQANGTYSIKGKDSEPAKFIFQVEDIR